MKILNGKFAAYFVKNDVKQHIKDIAIEYNDRIKLVVIQVGNNSASNTYIRNKEKACEYVGIISETYNFDENITQREIIDIVQMLNDDESVNGILVQLPLPKHLNADEIVNSIDPLKDVDGFTFINSGKLARSHMRDVIAPCTPLGIMNLLKWYQIDIAGKNCVVIGRSNIVGRPIAEMLLNADATVTVCHSHTENLVDICKNADILICSIGKPKFFTKEYIKDGAVVIDVGMNRDENGKLCGDVDFDDVSDMNISITPVPGGVGQMTVATLMQNCVLAYQLQHENV